MLETTPEARAEELNGWFRGKDGLWRYEIDETTIEDKAGLLSDIESVSDGTTETISTNFPSYF
jgi:hypothetical protein